MLQTAAILHPNPPLAPTGLTTTGKTATSVALSWAAVVDSRGIKGYEVYKDGVKVTTVTGTTHDVTGLTATTNYKFKIKAVANDDMVSDFSNELSVTTS